MAKNQERLVTPRFRVAFAQVFTPKAAKEGAKPKYSLTAIFEPGTDLVPMGQLAANAVAAKWPDEAARPTLRKPFRKGEEKKQFEGFADVPGKIFCSLSSQYQPQIIDHVKVEIFTEQDFYSGCWARATVHAYAYSNSGNNGVAFGLNNIQKLGKGKPFAGRTDASEDFDKAEEIAYEGAEAAPPSSAADDFLS